jgi:hypothetical protein
MVGSVKLRAESGSRRGSRAHRVLAGQPGSRRGDMPGEALNATDVIWEFFTRHFK